MSVPQRVLIVDDEALVRKMTSAGVRSAFPEVEIETADNVTQAKGAIAACLPSLLITDMMMMDGTGLDVIAALRDASGEERVPCIIITAFHKEPGLEQRIEQVGVDAVLEKPFKISQLATLCADLLNMPSALEQKQPSRQSPEAVSAPASPAPSPMHDTTCFDRDKALELVGFNRKLAANVASVLLAETPDRIAEMNILLASLDFQTLRKKAHNLKGNAANFAAEELRSAAYGLETAAKAGDATACEIAHKTLEQAFEHLNTTLTAVEW
ncbi:MAG: Hpt domain-containing response regulator [Planctomycetota bacterium]